MQVRVVHSLHSDAAHTRYADKPRDGSDGHWDNDEFRSGLDSLRDAPNFSRYMQSRSVFGLPVFFHLCRFFFDCSLSVKSDGKL